MIEAGSKSTQTPTGADFSGNRAFLQGLAGGGLKDTILNLEGGIETMAEKKSFEAAVKPILDKQSQAVLKYSKNHSPYEVVTFDVPDKTKYQKALQAYYEKAALQGIANIAKQAKPEITAEAEAKVKQSAKER